MESLTQTNEGLMIQNESLERDLADRERELEVSRADRNWLLQVGLVRMMDKLLELPEFTGGISRIHHAAFAAGEESGWANLKALVDAGTYDPSASDSRLSHSSALDDALLAFATMDFAGLLGLGYLDVDRVRVLCAFDEGEGAVEGLGVGVCGASSGIGGDAGGAGDGVGGNAGGNVGGAGDGVVGIGVDAGGGV